MLRDEPCFWLRLPIGLTAAALLASCSSPCQPFQQPVTKPAELRAPFTVDARNPWHHTGLILIKDRRYCITSRAIGDYQDSTQPCTPEGPSGCAGKSFDLLARQARCWLNPIHWIGPGAVKHLRVLKDAHGQRASFLTLIAAIGEDDSRGNVHVIGTGRTFYAHTTGELVLFANDWPGLPQNKPAPADYYDREGRLISKSYLNNSGTLEVTVHQSQSPAA